ncbi:MAG: aromatic acid exporter family protein [Eubacterium sp.]
MKELFVRSLKIASACILSIITANFFNLQYSVTAGIITILSIGGTKRETLKTAAKRSIAFLCALIIAFVCFYLFGFNTLGFSIYIFTFVLVCLKFNLKEAIAMDSVLITHFLTNGNISVSLISNEIFLFIIGTGYGVIINLMLRKNSNEFIRLADEVDNEVKGILERMSSQILTKDENIYDGKCFEHLDEKLSAAKLCALNNYGNVILHNSAYEIAYVEMRQKQRMVLENIYKSILMITFLPEQANMVSNFINKVSLEYHRYNNVENLLMELDNLLLTLKNEEMPQIREEFEARAILFYMLKQMQELLNLKHDFVLKYKNE